MHGNIPPVWAAAIIVLKGQLAKATRFRIDYDPPIRPEAAFEGHIVRAEYRLVLHPNAPAVACGKGALTEEIMDTILREATETHYR